VAKKWAETPKAERAQHFANVTEQTHGSWLAAVTKVMVELGCGWGAAMDKVREQESQRQGGGK
jgi:hypothetical protein